MTIVCLVVGLRLGAATVPTSDGVLITTIAPASLAEGEETEVVVKVAYSLASQDTAVLELNFNTMSPQGMHRTAGEVVRRGVGELTLRGRVTPRAWGRSIPFRAAVFLIRPDDGATVRSVAASDVRSVPLLQRAKPASPEAGTPPAESMYDDGIMITSITPDHFRDGVEQEVTVRVKYELFSREAGQINLGSSNGRPTGYTIIKSELVKIGSGEAEIRAKIIPRKTGDLPFAKVNVNLSEYPHPKRWQPLAGDEITIEVE